MASVLLVGYCRSTYMSNELRIGRNDSAKIWIQPVRPDSCFGHCWYCCDDAAYHSREAWAQRRSMAFVASVFCCDAVVKGTDDHLDPDAGVDLCFEVQAAFAALGIQAIFICINMAVADPCCPVGGWHADRWPLPFNLHFHRRNGTSIMTVQKPTSLCACVDLSHHQWRRSEHCGRPSVVGAACSWSLRIRRGDADVEQTSGKRILVSC